MDNLEYIEAYFDGTLSTENKQEFEQRITSDTDFAETVSFFLSAKQAASAEIKAERERFKIIYSQYKLASTPESRQPGMLKRILPWVAAVAVLAGIIFSWYAWFKPVFPGGLADKYIVENFQTLPVKMGNKEDSLQAGLRLYNEGRQEESMKYFESIAFNDTTFIEAKKYAGIVSLRLGQYDKAIYYFSLVENTQLYANPGKFYHALTLMKRNRPGDTETAKQLLQQVVENDLEGKEDAEKWLAKW